MSNSSPNPIFQTLQKNNNRTMDLREICLNCLGYFSHLAVDNLSPTDKFCIGLYFKDDMNDWKPGPTLFSVLALDPVKMNCASDYLSQYIDIMVKDTIPCQNGDFNNFIDLVEKNGGNVEYEIRDLDGYFCYDASAINGEFEFMFFIHSSNSINKNMINALMHVTEYFSKKALQINKIHNRLNNGTMIWKDTNYCKMFFDDTPGMGNGEESI